MIHLFWKRPVIPVALLLSSRLFHSKRNKIKECRGRAAFETLIRIYGSAVSCEFRRFQFTSSTAEFTPKLSYYSLETSLETLPLLSSLLKCTVISLQLRNREIKRQGGEICWMNWFWICNQRRGRSFFLSFRSTFSFLFVPKFNRTKQIYYFHFLVFRLLLILIWKLLILIFEWILWVYCFKRLKLFIDHFEILNC